MLAERRPGAAVGAFTCYDLEAAIATVRAAASEGAGVILLLGGQSYAGASGGELLAALLAVAGYSDARVCVQLDHCDDLALIEAALDVGVGAVLADGSALPYEQNVSFVRRAVELAERRGASVEAELGGIAGDEDVAEAVAAGALTEPSEAAAFVTATRADCLAVSIGNVHGEYRDPPELDWARLSSIRDLVTTPLALHGASGLPDAMVAEAISTGIAKINVNTELRKAYLATTAEALPTVLTGSRLSDLHASQVDAVARVVAAKLGAFAVGVAS